MEDRYFKAKRLDNGEWVQGFYLYDYGRNIHYIFANEIVCPNCINDCRKEFSLQDYEVDPSTICQCTGLKDENGELIWENDIVKDLFSDVCAQIKYGSYQNCFDSTKTEHVGFYVGWSGKHTKRYRKDLGYWINMVDAEVIGNTFDNPELLEVHE